ncbi:MAG: hypothetical protein LC780_04515 [Acidobacteria bacterium]|nr:hypothetical protein [Acidobacteriota bacterium]
MSTQPSSRWRNVTTISVRAARAWRNASTRDRSGEIGFSTREGSRSASKSTMRVHPTVFFRPSAASRVMTKRSRS